VRNRLRGCGLDSSGSWQGPVAGCYEFGVPDQPSGFMKEERSSKRTLIYRFSSVIPELALPEPPLCASYNNSRRVINLQCILWISQNCQFEYKGSCQLLSSAGAAPRHLISGNTGGFVFNLKSEKTAIFCFRSNYLRRRFIFHVISNVMLRFQRLKLKCLSARKFVWPPC
jgi:hypothetical protein